MAERLILEPFIEESDELFGGEEFVAGFRDEQGAVCGIVVPVSRPSLERLILLSERFELWFDTDGSIQCRPEEVSDDIYAEMVKAQTVLPRLAVDRLVADMIEGHRNEPNDGADGILKPFQTLRARLQRALAMVEAEIARRNTDGGKRPPNSRG